MELIEGMEAEAASPRRGQGRSKGKNKSRGGALRFKAGRSGSLGDRDDKATGALFADACGGGDTAMGRSGRRRRGRRRGAGNANAVVPFDDEDDN